MRLVCLCNESSSHFPPFRDRSSQVSAARPDGCLLPSLDLFLLDQWRHCSGHVFPQDAGHRLGVHACLELENWCVNRAVTFIFISLQAVQVSPKISNTSSHPCKPSRSNCSFLLLSA